ncbi:MAG: TonB-dependent receptor, partial [Gammaproteobacteria bacterium]|nr:TonB-dependent receptor [Gammaproteobacteria bacterium]
VLKGPQSALYGRDTFAGAINYVTRSPELGRFSGHVQGDLGTNERYGLKGSMNVPMGEAAALRLFGGYSSFDGTIKNIRGGDNLGGYDKRLTVGGSVYFEPTDTLRLQVFFARNEVREDQPPLRQVPFSANASGSEYQVPNAAGGFDTIFSSPTGRAPVFDDIDLDPRGTGNDGYLNLGYINVETDLPFATLSGNYSFSRSSYSNFIDNSGDASAATRPITPGNRFSAAFFTNQSGDVSDQRAVELRLTSREGSDIYWLVGGSYYDFATGDITSSIASLVDDPSTTEIITLIPRSLETESFAAYAAVTVPVRDRLNIGGEIRYTDESQLQTGRREIFFLPLPTLTTSDTIDLDYWTGRVSVDYEVADDVLVYAYAARGLKTGGINTGFEETSPLYQFGPETNWTYELGVKSQFWDRRAILNAAVFYIDWRDVQVRAPGSITTSSAVINGAGATSKGVEIDGALQVTDNFTVRAAASYTDPTHDNGFLDGSLDGICPQTPPAAPIVTVSLCSNDVSGKQLPRTSKFQFFGSATHEFPNMIGDFTMFARADYSHRGAQYISSLNAAQIGAIDLVSARFGLRNDRMSIAVWADNLLDKDYNARVLPLGATGSPVPGIRRLNVFKGNGRTFGLTLATNF